MAFFPRLAIATAAVVLACSSALAQVTVADVKYDADASVNGTSLHLNGAGIRYKAVFKVYTAGLYLEKKAETTPEVLGQKGAKRLRIVMLREIDATELGKLFSRGMEDNLDRATFSKLIPGVMRMSQIFTDHKKLLPGEEFSIDWIPGTGTVITVKGKVQGESFKEPEFFNAMLNIWLGQQPADWKLKDALLGKSS
jgi:hypothetical protein